MNIVLLGILILLWVQPVSRAVKVIYTKLVK
jgi:hypothetical protein